MIYQSMKFLWVIMLVLMSNVVKAKTIKVGPNEQFKTIKSAIEAANDHDVIQVKKGIYEEFDIEIKKPLSIVGEQGVIVDGMNRGQIFHIMSDNVSLRQMFI